MRTSSRNLPFFVVLVCLLLCSFAFSAIAQEAAAEPGDSTPATESLPDKPKSCSVTCQGSTWACCNVTAQGASCACFEQTELPNSCQSGGAHTSSCSIGATPAPPEESGPTTP